MNRDEDPGAERPDLDDAAVFDRLVESIGPASMLVALDQRMGTLLRQRMSAADVWQETLLHAWRDRARLQWKGLAAFRRWLMEIAEHRLHDLRDRESAGKRGSGVAREALP